MKSTLFSLIALLYASNYAQIVPIPDANLKTKLLSHSPVIDTNGDGEIQVSEAEAITMSLNINDANISNTSGIEAFKNIMYLNCQNNLISSIDLTALSNLERFTAWGNSLESLDVTQNPNLKILVVSGSDLTALDVTQNPLLEDLQIDYNSISYLDLTNNPNLKIFSSSYNLFETLDFSQSPDLEFASLSANSNLRMINFQNGNNSILDIYIHEHLNLECIQIDSEFVGAIPEEWDVQEGVTFSDNCVLGLDENLSEKVEIYPNPVQNIVYFSSNSDLQKIQIFNEMGQMVYESENLNFKKGLTISNFPTGLYLITIKTKDGWISKKLIKK